jgi:uncharacterized protein YcbK (DUF882 family)
MDKELFQSLGEIKDKTELVIGDMTIIRGYCSCHENKLTSFKADGVELSFRRTYTGKGDYAIKAIIRNKASVKIDEKQSKNEN